ncbi:MAG TPA: septal ring lytic transglycosylase RlpA family protein [Nitrospira sp.]|nr:septal ring lytic transglycosylase RlpA family protein [Nitrospira sp.]
MTHHMAMKSTLAMAMALAGGLSVSACAWVPKGDAQFDVGMKDRGIASWYGQPFHGRQAADGTIYDMEGLTAAHRTFPLGSIVRVVNLNNGRFLFLKITDRGPYVKGRILDLSHAAAVRLGIEESGLAPVQVEIVGERRPDALLPSEVLAALPHVRILQAASGEPRRAPVFDLPFRSLPSDLWLHRRTWRVPAMVAAEHMPHGEPAGLIVG